MGGSRSHFEFFFGKSFQNVGTCLELFWYTMCIMFVYALLKVVSYYDLSVLSMSVMGFRKEKSLDGGWVGWVSSIQVYFGFWEFFNFAKPLSKCEIKKCYLRDFIHVVEFFLHLSGAEESVGAVVLMLEAGQTKHSQVCTTLKPNNSFNKMSYCMFILLCFNVPH